MAAYIAPLGTGEAAFIIGLDEGRLPADVELALYVDGRRVTGWQITGLPQMDTNAYYVSGVDFTLEAGQEVALSLRKTNPATDSELRSLAVSAGTLSPAYEAETTAYVVTVDNDVSTVTVMADVSSSYASVTVTPEGGDDPGTAGAEVAIAEGENTITVTVTAEDGSMTAYTLTVTRESG